MDAGFAIVDNVANLGDKISIIRAISRCLGDYVVLLNSIT